MPNDNFSVTYDDFVQSVDCDAAAHLLEQVASIVNNKPAPDGIVALISSLYGVLENVGTQLNRPNLHDWIGEVVARGMFVERAVREQNQGGDND